MDDVQMFCLRTDGVGNRKRVWEKEALYSNAVKVQYQQNFFGEMVMVTAANSYSVVSQFSNSGLV